MYKQRLRMACVAVGLGMVASGSALAEGEGFYFGLSGGVTSIDLPKAEFDAEFRAFYDPQFPAPTFNGSLTSKLDDSDNGWGVQIGYRWNSYIAAEVGYVDLGKAVYKGGLAYTNVSTNPVVVTELIATDLRFESSGPTLSLVGMFPIGERFDIHARAGVYFGDTRERVRTIAASDPDSFESSERKGGSSDLLFGIGATWNINDSYSVRLEWQRFDKVGDSDKTAEVDIDLISLGFLFR